MISGFKWDIFVGEMTTLIEREEELVSEFEMFDDWMEKYEYIIDLGKDLDKLPEEHRSTENLITGCQSQVWLYGSLSNERIWFQADSNAIITKGLVALVVRLFSGALPKEILECDLSFIEKIGLKEHLSPTRSNGLLFMIKQMKNYAFALEKA